MILKSNLLVSIVLIEAFAFKLDLKQKIKSSLKMRLKESAQFQNLNNKKFDLQLKLSENYLTRKMPNFNHRFLKTPALNKFSYGNLPQFKQMRQDIQNSAMNNIDPVTNFHTLTTHGHLDGHLHGHSHIQGHSYAHYPKLIHHDEHQKKTFKKNSSIKLGTKIMNRKGKTVKTHCW